MFGVLLVATLAWGALAFGAVYAWAYWPLAISSASLGLWASVTTRAWRDPRARTLLIALGATALAIGVQLIALPYSVLAWLSPGVDTFLRQFAVGYHPAALHPLSIAPGSTAGALALFVAFALLLVGAMRAMRFVRLEWLVSQLMGLGIALALVGVIQQAFLDEKAPLVYGFWEPQFGAAPYGPFINKNHFAGWMVMVLPVLAGYAYALFQRTPRPSQPGLSGWVRWATTVEASRFVLVSTVGLAMSLSVVLTGSRSGLASLLVALTFLAYAVWRSTHPGHGRRAALGFLGALVLGALAWGGADTLLERFARAPAELEGRFAAWRDTREIIGDFPWFGTGLGTYGRAMLVYQTGDRSSMYVQAHNDYLQVIAEGGLLVSVPVAIVVGLVVAGIRRRLSSGQDDRVTVWVRLGAVAGLLGIAAQSLVEFSLQMPGNAVLFVVLMAIALHRPDRALHATRV
jgi:hypothetical protein